jgi:hypothetical protein
MRQMLPIRGASPVSDARRILRPLLKETKLRPVQRF